MSIEHSTWTVERNYPHPPSLVFAAWADPSTKVRWFDLSGAADPDYHSDFRVGGQESFRTPRGSSPAFTYDARYHDIVEAERIVITYEMSIDGRRMSVSLATVDFRAEDGGTLLVFTEQGAYLDGLDDPKSRRTGTTDQLGRLGSVLGGQP